MPSSPTTFALRVDWFGGQISLYPLLGCSLVAWMAIELMSRWYEGAQARASSHSAPMDDRAQQVGS
jgi:hypothetical protein